MDKLQAGSCASTTPTRRQSYFDSISLWKTPLATCDNGQNNCVPYAQWVSAWTRRSSKAAGRPDAVRARASAALWRRPWARATLLLTPPLAWFVLLYLAALVVLLITAFWQINPFTTNIERVWSLNNFHTIFTSPAYRRIIGRTVGMAAAVTVTDAVVAFPFAYFMARVASPRTRTALFVAILLPLWASLPGQGVLLAADLHPRRGAQLGRERAPDLHQLGRVHRVLLPVAAVHDHPGVRGAGADPGLADRGVAGPGRADLADHAVGAAAAGAARHRGRVDLHLLADPRATTSRRCWSAGPARPSSATSSTPTSASRTTCRSPPRWRWCRWRSWPSTCSARGRWARSRRSR